MRVIGTGWRYWGTSQTALDTMFVFMDTLLDLVLMTNTPVLQLVLGGGHEQDEYRQGADWSLMEWATIAATEIAGAAVPAPIVFPANWDKFGKAAGPLRNADMITAGADLVVGFIHPESKGTVDCLTKAKRARISRMIIPWAPDKDPVDQPSTKLEVVDGVPVFSPGAWIGPVAEAA